MLTVFDALGRYQLYGAGILGETGVLVGVVRRSTSWFETYNGPIVPGVR